MGVWISTATLILVLIALIRAEIRGGRKSKTVLRETNQQINELAKTTFNRFREKHGRDPTGTFPLTDPAEMVDK